MNRLLKAISDFALHLSMVIFLVAIWLGLAAYLDAKHSETDAMRLTAQVDADRAMEANAMAPRDPSSPLTASTKESP